MPPYVFISYANSDDITADDGDGIITRIQRHLQVAGRHYCGRKLEIFRDRDLAPGVEWEREIFDLIRSALIFMPVIRPAG